MTSMIQQRLLIYRLFRHQIIKNNSLKLRGISSSHKVFAEDKTKETSVTPLTNEADNAELMEKPEMPEMPKRRGVIQNFKDSHDKLVRESSGNIIIPNSLDKVALLWSGKYATPEEIPPMIHARVQAAADNKLRVVILLWIMSTCTIGLLTIIQFGQRRLRKAHEAISQKQNKIWAAREEAATQKLLEKDPS